MTQDQEHRIGSTEYQAFAHQFPRTERWGILEIKKKRRKKRKASYSM
jgi:hypothetical protein